MNPTARPAHTESPTLSRSSWPASAREWALMLPAGVLVGLYDLVFSVAIGALLFAGPLAGGLGLAVSAAILSTVLASAASALFSRLPCAVGTVQDAGVAVLAQTLAVVAASQALPEPVRVASALAIVALATVASGLLMWLTGRLGWGRLAHYLPQPVLAGFLAGTGWLLFSGGLALATGLPAAGLLQTASWTPQRGLLALAALLFGLLLWGVTRRFAWKGALMALVFTGLAGFHAVLWTAGLPLSAAQAAGWTPLVTAQAGGVPQLWTLAGSVDGALLAAAWPAVLTTAFLTLLALLMNTSALSAISGQEADLNRELRVTGLCNLAIGSVAGPPGHASVSSSLMGLRAGVTQRGLGLLVAVVCLLGLFAVDRLLALVPLFVSGGLIVYLGLDLLHDWLLGTWRRYSRGEWAIVLVILLLVVGVGFAEAMVAGLLIACAMFAWNYAAVPILRRTGTLHHFASSLARSPAEAGWLRAHGATVAVIELQGYVFFGTAERLREQVRSRVVAPGTPPLQRLIVDFGYVVGLDAAAGEQFARLAGLATQHRLALVFSGCTPTVQAALARAVPALFSGPVVRFAPTLDEALEQAEDALLHSAAPGELPTATLLERLAPDAADRPHLERFFGALPSEQLAAGSLIMAAGEEADSVVFLEAGRAVIRASAPAGASQRLRGMAAGAVLGDIGLALKTPRTADVVAETAVVLRRLTLAELQRIEREDPPLCLALHRLLCRALAEKIVGDQRVSTMRGEP